MSKSSHYPRTGLLGWLSVLKWEGMREVDRQNEKRVNIYAFMWALSMIGVALVVAYSGFPEWVGWVAAAVPAAIGILCLRAYLRLLRAMDELLRQMQFEAMAVGFGTAMIVGTSTITLGLPSEWTAVATIVPMTLAYCGRIILGARDLAALSNEDDVAEMEPGDE